MTVSVTTGVKNANRHPLLVAVTAVVVKAYLGTVSTLEIAPAMLFTFAASATALLSLASASVPVRSDASPLVATAASVAAPTLLQTVDVAS